jgi:hypothetical protein
MGGKTTSSTGEAKTEGRSTITGYDTCGWWANRMQVDSAALKRWTRMMTMRRSRGDYKDMVGTRTWTGLSGHSIVTVGVAKERTQGMDTKLVMIARIMG